MRLAASRRKPSTRSSRTPTRCTPRQKPWASRSSSTSRTRATAGAASPAAISRCTFGPSAVTPRGEGLGCAAAGTGAELLLCLLRVVVRVDIGHVEGTVGVDLYHRRHLGKSIVVHLARQEVKSAGGQRVFALRVELVAHAEIERARYDRHVLVLGVPVRCDLVAGGRFEPHDERPRLPGVALQHCDLCALGHRRRRVSPFDIFGIDESLRVTCSLRQCRTREYGGGDQSQSNSTLLVDRRSHGRIAPFTKRTAPRWSQACEVGTASPWVAILPAHRNNTSANQRCRSRRRIVEHDRGHVGEIVRIDRYRGDSAWPRRSEEHTSELQSHHDLVCRLLLEKKKKKRLRTTITKNKSKTTL